MKLIEKQSALLTMMKKIDILFEENGIKYTLLGGSVLGAIRHKGFIPWDDDIDIGVFRSDYKKAENLLKTIKEYSYEPVEEHTIPEAPIGKLRFPTRNEDICNWCAIDVFALDGLPEDEKSQKKIFKSAKWYHLAILGRPTQNRGFFMRVVTFVMLKIIPKSLWNKIQKKSLKIITEYDVTKSKFIGNIFGAWGKKEVFQRDVYEKTIKVQFEDTQFYIPFEYDKYLTQMYGNYMTPPPEEYRFSNHTNKRKY